MSENSKSNYEILGGSIQNAGDMVGGDKIVNQTIYQIFGLSDLLNTLGFQKLFGTNEGAIDLPKDAQGLVKLIETRLGEDVVKEMAFASDVLFGFLEKFKTNEPTSVLPIRQIISELPQYIFATLNARGYWDSFYKLTSVRNARGLDGAEVVWLYATQALWKNKFDSNRLFGLGTYARDPYHPHIGIYYFLESQKDDYSWSLPSSALDNTEFRVFMIGLIIDLMRIASTASQDIDFWNSFASLLVRNKAKD